MFIKERFPSEVLFSTFLVLFFTGYYFSILSSSEHSSLIRLIVVLGLFYLFFYFRKDFKKITFFKINSLLKVFLFLYISYLLSLSFYYEDWKSVRRVLFLFLFIFFVYSYINDFSIKTDKLIYSISLLSGIVGAAYLYTHYGNNGFDVQYREDAISKSDFKVLADYGNTIVAGLYLSFLIPFCLWSYFKVKSRLLSVLYYFIIYFTLTAVFLTFARTAWLAAATFILVFVVFKLTENKIKKIVLLVSPLLLVFFYYLLNFINLDIKRGVTYRDQIWIEFISNISGSQQWLFGKGLSEPLDFVKLPDGGFALHSHSIYIESLYLTGLIGLLLMCALLFLSIYTLFKMKSNEQSVLWAAILIGLAVSMFFDYSGLIYSPNIMWLWFWFPVSIAVAYSNRDRVEINKL